jgi:putative MFS transporter
VGACVVFFLGIETRNRSLEDIEEGGVSQPQDLQGSLGSTEMRG